MQNYRVIRYVVGIVRQGLMGGMTVLGKHHQQQRKEGDVERRYKPETLRKVVELASRLQAEHRETLTPQEIEAIGVEVGLDPVFVRQAITQFTQRKAAVQIRKPVIAPEMRKPLAAAWWAAGWTLPFILAAADLSLIGGGAGFFIGWAIYIGGGVFLSSQAKGSGKSSEAKTAKLSRSELLEMLFALQRALEGQKQRRAFLSVDVVGSSEMKRGAPELAVEYSFSQFRRWMEDIVQAHGGQVHSTAGDGMMCMFPDDVSAVRAALQLQKGLPQFNAAHNRLPVPFRIRCGISAGEVAIEEGMPIGHLISPVIDRAAELQKRAEPGDIVVGGEVSATALMELGSAAPLSDLMGGQPAFSWQAGQRHGL